MACLLSLALVWSARADEENASVTIKAVETWSSLFAGKDADSFRNVDVHLLVKAPDGFRGRLLWRVSLGGAVIQRQEVGLAGSAKPIKITLRVPYVRDGVVVDGKLVAAVMRDGQGSPAATYDQPLHLFPYQPFFQRAQWLKDLKLNLYDPSGSTAPHLKKMDIPFEEVRELAVLAETKDGLVLIGEGVSLDEERGLGGTLVKLAARGLPVLCLAPAKGLLPIPEAKNGALPAPPSIRLNDTEVISRLDKRFDSSSWPSDGKVIASALVLKAIDGAVVGDVTDGGDGWPWLEIRYANGGRLILCGFGIISHWDAGPTPRFLFARILESLKPPNK